MLCLDHLVALSKSTVFNPLLALYLLVLPSRPFSLPLNLHLHLDPTIVYASLVLLGWTLVVTSSLWLQHPRLRSIRADEWSRELVVVTGASSGIGAHVSLQLALLGARVVTLDVQPSNYTALAGYTPDEVRRAQTNLHAYTCDLASVDALVKVVHSIKAVHGDATVLVNNAGVTNSRALVDSTPADVVRLVDVNLVAPLLLVQSFLPGMLRAESRGSVCQIVSISSIMGHVGISKMTDYCATKHGLVGLHRALRYELASHHRSGRIRTTLFVLGHVATAMFEGVSFNPLARFLAPSSEPRYVAASVVEAIRTRREGTVAVPWYANWTQGLALLPSWAADAVQWASGADRSLDHVQRSR
ncbi:hypothetical protein ACQY0O_000670 [Thecaphora frezii]